MIIPPFDVFIGTVGFIGVIFQRKVKLKKNDAHILIILILLH